MSPDLAQKLAGRRVVASVSGGKDSAALSLWLTEQGIDHDRVFLDTGWESEKTYEYLRGPLTQALGHIIELQRAGGMEALILEKGMFPSRTIRFCTEELKVFLMQDFLNERVAAGDDLVNAVGIRHQESEKRASMPEWEWSKGFDCEVWRPLIRWTEQDVVDIHARHGLRPNPLYLLGASRVGCWPCIYARKSEIKLIADVDPARIDRIRELEAKVEIAARARWERDRAEWLIAPPLEPLPAANEAGDESQEHERWRRKKERLIDRPFQAPAWFQAQSKAADGHYPMVPIDEVVRWSRTSRGGKQFEMFAAAGRDAGCMRWGLCETNAPDGEDDAA